MLGGTFDPVHNAHLAMARAAMEVAGLDRVLFVIAARPPHKTEGAIASEEDRLAMVQAAVAGEPAMEASRIEMDRPGESYTIDTLRTLKAVHPDKDLFLILGLDSLVDLPHWNEPREILALAHLLAIPRPGEFSIPPLVEGHYTLAPIEETNISSTDIRRRIAGGQPVNTLVPAAVERYMRDHHVYDGADFTSKTDMLRNLARQRLNERTYRHLLSVTDLAKSAAYAIDEDVAAAELAGLLHDLCKNMKGPELLEAAKSYGIEIPELQREHPKLLHGPVAAEEGKRVHGIDSPDVYEAVYWHTTGRPGLCRLGQVLYFADFAEPLRTYPESAEARAILERDGFAKALRFVADAKLHYVRKKAAVDPISAAFHAWLIEVLPHDTP